MKIPTIQPKIAIAYTAGVLITAIIGFYAITAIVNYSNRELDIYAKDRVASRNLETVQIEKKTVIATDPQAIQDAVNAAVNSAVQPAVASAIATQLKQ